MKFHLLAFAIVFTPLYYQCTSKVQSEKDGNNQALTARNDQQSNLTQDSNELPQADKSNDQQIKNNSNSSGKSSANKNPFGVLIARTDNRQLPPAEQIKVAKALGVQYMRARINVVDWNGSNEAYDQYAAAGFKIVLNINYDMPRDEIGNKKTIPFPKDMQAYSKKLNSILDKYKPELVVIENEEDNPGYHSGSAEDYLEELKTATEICHSKGLKVTNAGITDREIALLVYDDLVRSGKKDEATEFAKHAFPAPYLTRINNLYENNPQIARQLQFGRKIIQAYKTLDIDYINFHWYEPAAARGVGQGIVSHEQHVDPLVFEKVINFLKRTTGKPIITNECGELNASPAIVTELMQKILNAGMDYALWYSADGGAGKAVALQSGDGNLRENGKAFRDFIKEHCQ